MQINSNQNPSALYGKQATPEAKPEKAAQDLRASAKEKELTVSISPEAQALQKAAAAQKSEETERSDSELATQQQAQPPAGKTRPRIDLTV